jgi:hypothetical protein
MINLINILKEIVVKPTSSYRFDIGDQLLNRVGGRFIISAQYRNKEEAIQAFPEQKSWIESQVESDKDGNSPWYGLVVPAFEEDPPTIMPELHLMQKGWTKI